MLKQLNHFRFSEMTKHEICLAKERIISMYIVYLYERLQNIRMNILNENTNRINNKYLTFLPFQTLSITIV